MSFFFNDTATTEIYTLSLHDALPILVWDPASGKEKGALEDLKETVTALALTKEGATVASGGKDAQIRLHRSEEHTSELQSRQYLVCRLLLEKKKTHIQAPHSRHQSTI